MGQQLVGRLLAGASDPVAEAPEAFSAVVGGSGPASSEVRSWLPSGATPLRAGDRDAEAITMLSLL